MMMTMTIMIMTITLTMVMIKHDNGAAQKKVPTSHWDGMLQLQFFIHNGSIIIITMATRARGAERQRLFPA